MLIVGVPGTSVGPDMEGVRECSAGGQPGAGETASGATLTLAAVPIGTPADASSRLTQALAQARIVAAEDTRRVRRLAAALGVRLAGTVVSYYDDVEAARAAELLAELTAGHDVLLVTDAGMPGISDPGYRLVAAAAAAGIRVTVLPGPSAATAALAVSGLPSDRFCFEGFPPRRGGRAGPPVRGTGRRAAHADLLRVAAPAGQDAGRPGRRVRPGPGRRRLPRADQDP